MASTEERLARAICKTRKFFGCDQFCRAGCQGRTDTLQQNGSYNAARELMENFTILDKS